MTPTQPGQPEKKKSSGRLAAGAAALSAVVGLTGWAVAAGPLAPPPEPMSRSVQAEVPSDPPSVDSGASPETPAVTSPESESELEFLLAPPAPEPGTPDGEAQAPGSPAAPGQAEVAPAPAAPDAGRAAPPAAGGKIINEPPPVAAAKGFGSEADVATGVKTKVKALKSVQGEARGVGEVGGPAVQFTLEVTNTTAAPISLAEAVVNVERGADRIPAEELSGPGAVPFPAEVAPGQKVSGVFVFQVPPEERKTVRVLFHYQAVLPVAAFEGAAPVQGETP